MIVTSFGELESLTITVWKLAGDESRLCQAAVTWLIVNRIAAVTGAEKVGDVCQCVLEDGRYGLARQGSEMAQPGSKGDLNDPQLCRVAIRILKVLARETADPIDGATLFHRHDEAPEWSRDLEPVALIGAYFFYRQNGGYIAPASVGEAIPNAELA